MPDETAIKMYESAREKLRELVRQEIEVKDQISHWGPILEQLARLSGETIDPDIARRINELKQECIQYLQKQPEIAFAIDMQKVSDSTIPTELKGRIINGYNLANSGTIQIILKPAYYTGHGSGDGGPTGTTHGTWNPYDAHIPMLFMGWGIKHGALAREVHMTDIAPTISSLLHIQAPNGSIGHPVVEVLK